MLLHRLRAMARDRMTKWWLIVLAIGIEQMVDAWWHSWWNLAPFVGALALLFGYRLVQVRRWNEQQRRVGDSNPRGLTPN